MYRSAHRPLERRGRRALWALRRAVAISVVAWHPGVGAQPTDGDEDPAIVHAAAEDGGPRRFRLDAEGGLPLRAEPVEGGARVETLADDALLENLGCASWGDRAWCRVRSVPTGARGHVPTELLTPAPGPDGTVPIGVDDSRRRARRGDFDVAATVACAQTRHGPMDECEARAARGGGGDAAVRVTFPNGFARTLHFVHGTFVSADATMSGVGTDVDLRREGGMHLVRVEDQRYEIPDGLVVAGSDDEGG